MSCGDIWTARRRGLAGPMVDHRRHGPDLGRACAVSRAFGWMDDRMANGFGAERDTKRVVLDSPAKLFRIHGYAATSLRDIAAAAGMKAGSLYYHFSSKDEI